MPSLKQLRANRKNAKKSTGPKTPEGKATVRFNALKHGLLSNFKVIPGIEEQEDWNTHLDRTISDFQPQGYMEKILTERIALLTWKLNRIVRYEEKVVLNPNKRIRDDRNLIDLILKMES